MSNIKDWSTSAGGNAIAANGGWPENMPASQVNDTARANIGAVRSWYEGAEWVNFGHTPVRSTATDFYVSGDKTGVYTSGRRIKASDGSSTIYGSVTTSTYSAAGSTGVYCSLDAGVFTASLSQVAVGIISTSGHTGKSVPVAQTASHATRASYFGFDETWSVSGTAGGGIPTIAISDNVNGYKYLVEAYISSATGSGAGNNIFLIQNPLGTGSFLSPRSALMRQTINRETGVMRNIFTSQSGTLSLIFTSALGALRGFRVHAQVTRIGK